MTLEVVLPFSMSRNYSPTLIAKWKFRKLTNIIDIPYQAMQSSEAGGINSVLLIMLHGHFYRAEKFNLEKLIKGVLANKRKYCWTFKRTEFSASGKCASRRIAEKVFGLVEYKSDLPLIGVGWVTLIIKNSTPPAYDLINVRKPIIMRIILGRAVVNFVYSTQLSVHRVLNRITKLFREKGFIYADNNYIVLQDD